jgi:hypothetical protein
MLDPRHDAFRERWPEGGFGCRNKVFAEVDNVMPLSYRILANSRACRSGDTVLSRRQLRDIFLNAQFGILDGSGRSDNPKQMGILLKRSGFRLGWTDASRVHAFRA